MPVSRIPAGSYVEGPAALECYSCSSNAVLPTILIMHLIVHEKGVCSVSMHIGEFKLI